MPATKNAMTRYALIDRMLASRTRAYSIQDITDTLASRLVELGQKPVSKRCVEKDLHYLVNDSPFEVEIEEYWIDAADRNDRPYRKRCIRYVDPTFSIFKPKLTEDEKTVLSAALDTLGSFEGLDNFEWLDDLKSRLHLEEREPVISLSKNLLDNSTLIARLFTAIRQRQAVRLHYHTFRDSSHGGTRSVSLSPHLLKEYNNRWFLIASAMDTGRILTFPLDRIDGFTLESGKPYRPAPEDLQERYEEIIGVTYDEESPLQEIIFWVSDESVDYVATKPIHGSQAELRGEREQRQREEWSTLTGGKFLKIECRENYELIRELTSFGAALVVTAPATLRARIASRTAALAARYRDAAEKE